MLINILPTTIQVMRSGLFVFFSFFFFGGGGGWGDHSLSLKMSRAVEKSSEKSMFFFFFNMTLSVFWSAIFAVFYSVVVICVESFRVNKAGNVSSGTGHSTCFHVRLELFCQLWHACDSCTHCTEHCTRKEKEKKHCWYCILILLKSSGTSVTFKSESTRKIVVN